MKTVINGVRYHVETCGNGFPLLALHGFTGRGASWMPFCQKWSSHSEMIMPDLIGHGNTDAPIETERYRVEDTVKDLIALLDQKSIEKTDVLGYSMGGRVALAFVILHPDRVRKLILESSTPGLKEEKERITRRIADEKLANLLIEKGIPAFVEYWEDIPLFSTMKSMPLQVQDAIREQRLLNRPEGLANSLIGMGTGVQPSWWDRLPELACEVLLVTGAEDHKFQEVAKLMLPLLRNGKWRSVKNAGHAIHVEQSEIFGTIVSEFLSNTY